MELEKSLVLVATNLKDYSDQQKAELQLQIDKALSDIELVKAIAQQTAEKSVTVLDVKSAFESDEEFVKSLTGPQGPVGEMGPQGLSGEKGEAVSAEDLIASLTVNEEFLQAVKGETGATGITGATGEKGEASSAEEVAELLLNREDFLGLVKGEVGPQGPTGEKGQDGLSVSAEEVATSIKLDYEFVKSLLGEKGEAGSMGPQGEKGDSGEQGPQGQVGPEGLSIKSFEISEDGELSIEMTDGQVVDLGSIKGSDGRDGIDGADGLDFDLNAFYETFKSDSELIESLKVDPTVIQTSLNDFFEKATGDLEVQLELVLDTLNDRIEEKLATVDDCIEDQKSLFSQLQEELEIVKSAAVEETENVTQEIIEASKALIEEKLSDVDEAVALARTKSIQLELALDNVNRSKVQQWAPEILIKSGQWVEHNGRYYVANRDTDSVPGDSTAYSLVLRGFEFRKAWSSDTIYERLDVVISSSGSAWIANKAQPNGEPGTTPDWNLLVKRGERGAKGDLGPQGLQGEKGMDASEILDVVYDYESEEMTFIKSDGSRISFDLPVISMIQDLVTKQWIERLDQFELPINDFRGLWNSNTTYQRGDVVTFTNGVSIAKQTVSGVAPMEFLSAEGMKQSGDSWQLMMAIAPPLTGGVGGGGEGSVGPMGPRGPIGPKGDTGPAGATGPQGPAGVDGKDGKDGAVGPAGPAGADGAQGPAGADSTVPGPAGVDGKDGAVGAQGPKGDLGATGDTGPKGDIGNTGPQGDVGPAGPQGEQGPAGANGADGAVGPKGDQGNQGIPGLGITFKGRVATVGDLPATAAQGDMYIIDATGDAWVWDDGVSAFENAGPIVGPTGSQGEAGADGAVGPEGPQGPAGPTTVSADADNTAVLGTDGLLYVGKPTGYLPTSGGDMTGPINVKGDGVVAFQMDNGFNFQAVLTSTALRYGTKSVLGFTEDNVVATVPFRILNAPTTDEHATNKKYVDDLIATVGGGSSYTLVPATGTTLGGVKVGSGLSVTADGTLSASAAGGAYLPLAGGTMTGGITLPTTVQSLTFGTSTYNIFGANGGVAVRYGNSNVVNFTATGASFSQKITAPASGIGLEFGSGGGYLAKVGTGFALYAGGQQRFKVDDVLHTSLVPIKLPSDPTDPLHAATKQYVDSKVGATIVSVADGATEPAAADYPEGALLVRYTP